MGELTLDSRTTAVVVIDLQQGIVAMPGNPYPSELVVANAARILESARKARSTVILFHAAVSADNGDGLKAAIDQPMPFSGQRPPDWSDLVGGLNRQPTDIVIVKRQWGAFYGTELDLQLRRRGIKTMVLCGIASEFGVESTAREAWERNYAVIFAEDAMTGRGGHEQSVRHIFPRLGRVRSTDQIAAAFQAHSST